MNALVGGIGPDLLNPPGSCPLPYSSRLFLSDRQNLQVPYIFAPTTRRVNALVGGSGPELSCMNPPGSPLLFKGVAVWQTELTSALYICTHHKKNECPGGKALVQSCPAWTHQDHVPSLTLQGCCCLTDRTNKCLIYLHPPQEEWMPWWEALVQSCSEPTRIMSPPFLFNGVAVWQTEQTSALYICTHHKKNECPGGRHWSRVVQNPPGSCPLPFSSMVLLLISTCKDLIYLHPAQEEWMLHQNATTWVGTCRVFLFALHMWWEHVLFYCLAMHACFAIVSVDMFGGLCCSNHHYL